MLYLNPTLAIVPHANISNKQRKDKIVYTLFDTLECFIHDDASHIDFRPVMIECNKAIRSSETVSLCDVGIKLSFKKWFHPRAWEFKVSLFTDRLPFGETVQVLPDSHKSTKILFLFVIVMEFTEASCSSSTIGKSNIELIKPSSK
ncbi:hypothetical protein V6N11_082054 [Hibiscus sabdariffa]|uniref:Uncharacterized protein n=1 Tax=Hibiscus sabdariffa TaxID=183260 RepID=A0ABR2QHF7_9ROSI